MARPDSLIQVTPPPLALGALSYALKHRRGDETMIVDGRLEKLSAQSILARAARFNPDVIGITSMTTGAPDAARLIESVKSRWPSVPVVYGGPHATGCGPGLLENCRADYLVVGEGEDAMVELLDALEGGADVTGIKGIASRADGEVVYAGDRAPRVDLQGLGTDWEGMHLERYFFLWRRNALNTVARSSLRVQVSFSRGCPFGCAFCHNIFGRRFRAFPVEEKLSEMAWLKKRYGVEEFEIIDDTFNLKLDRAKTVMQAIIDSGLNSSISFTNGLRADRMDRELLDLMTKAGTYRIDYAIESASPRVQELCHKKLDLERAREVVDMTAERGIVTGAYYMLGFPGETEEEMEGTVEYALSLKNHVASFFYLMPYPGTEFAESSPETSRLAREHMFEDASRISINLSAVPDETMSKIRKKGYRGFYFSPGRVARIVKDVPKNARLLASALDVAKLSIKDAVNY